MSTDDGKPGDPVLAHVLSVADDVFGRQVHAHDNFFDLGGDSITAIDLTTRLAEVLGGTPDVGDLIVADDLAAFAGTLQAPLLTHDTH